MRPTNDLFSDMAERQPALAALATADDDEHVGLPFCLPLHHGQYAHLLNGFPPATQRDMGSARNRRPGRHENPGKARSTLPVCALLLMWSKEGARAA